MPSFKNNILGDSKLKRFKSGILASNTPVSSQDTKIFLLFVHDITLKRIQSALVADDINFSEPQLFNILRKVGFAYQTEYRKGIASPFNIDQLIFADFVKGTAIQQLCETNNLDPQSLFRILRKIGLLYATYHQQAKKLVV